MQSNRRGLIGSALAFLGTVGLVRVSSAGAEAPPGYFNDQKVVYHNNRRGKDSGAYFKAVVKNLDNHIAAVGEGHIEIRVVSHGDGLAMFQAVGDDSDLFKKLDVRAGPACLDRFSALISGTPAGVRLPSGSAAVGF